MSFPRAYSSLAVPEDPRTLGEKQNVLGGVWVTQGAGGDAGWGAGSGDSDSTIGPDLPGWQRLEQRCRDARGMC